MRTPHEFPIARPLEVHTPLKAIRRHCLRCTGGSSQLVAACESAVCPLWAFRLGHKPDPAKLDRTTALHPVERGMRMGQVLDHSRQRRTAIRLMCVECCGMERSEITACTTWDCSLYPYRLGTKHAADRGDVAARQALWRKVGHDEYRRLINAELTGGASDAEIASAEFEASGDPEDDEA
jgi:hypothetical protein